MNPYISDLEGALKAVDASYVSFQTIAGLTRGERIENNLIFQSEIEEFDRNEYIISFLNSQKQLKEASLERNFCYELYHQWQLVIRNEGNENIYESLNLNGEVHKTNLLIALTSYSIIRTMPLFTKIESLSMLDQTYFIPDLVLHGGQHSVDFQKLIVEVKTGVHLNDNNFAKDFYKLALYQQLFQFENCVFIILNITLDRLKEYLNYVDCNIVNTDKMWFMIRSEVRTDTYRLNELV